MSKYGRTVCGGNVVNVVHFVIYFIGKAIDVDHHDSGRSRSYNVAEVKDFMKKQRKQRRAMRDVASKPSTSRCHKRHSAPLDSNLHSFTSRLADKKNVSLCAVFD